jgi:hypothetical protein
MRLSEWRGRAPHKDAMTAKVIAVIEPALAAMGADQDPHCWIAWGEDPGIRYVVLAPTDAGLVQLHVRVNVPQEGPRSSAKLVRWNRVQSGEFSVDVAGGHRLVSFQVEGQVMRGSDDEADAIAWFARRVFDAVDGRPTVPPTRATPKAAGPKRAPAGAARRKSASGG